MRGKKRKEKVQAKRDLEAKFQEIIENIHDFVYTLDLQGNITSANKSAFEKLGLTPDDLFKTNFKDLTPEKYQAQALKDFQTILQQGEIRNAITVLKSKTGKEIWVEFNSTAIVKDGKVLGTRGIARDITERKKTEEESEHLNVILRAIRNVNQLITREKDRNRLLKGICNNLVKTRGYHNAWIALLDESRRPVMTAETRVGKEFLLVVEQLKRGELTNCTQRALMQSGVLTIKDPYSTCGDCPLSKNYSGRGAMTVRLEYGGKAYGLLSVSIPTQFTADKEEETLFQEVAADISFALSKIELEEEQKKAEERLRESEEKYRTLVETAQEGIGITDSDENITFVNQAFADLLGYTKEELSGLNLSRISDKEDFAKFRKETKKRQRGESSTYECKLYTKTGGPKYFNVSATPLFDKSRTFTATLSLLSDITERKKAEEVIRKEKVEAYLNIAEVMLATVNADENITLINKEGCNILGYKEGELIGRNWFDTLVPQRTRAEVRGVFRKLMAGEIEPVEYYENPLLTKDGEERLIAFHNTVIRDSNGQIVGVLFSAEDITERKRAEEALRESEKRYRVLFEGSAEGILVADIETKEFKYVNPVLCKMLGYTEEELKRMNVAEIHPKDALEYVISEFEAQAQGEKTLASNIPCLRKDGTIIYADINTTKMSVDERECNVGFFRDITERKRLHEQLIQSEKLAAVGTLAYGIAHEFNNILAGMMANAEFGLITKDSQEIKECFETIVENSKRASSITNNLLVFARDKEAKKELADITQPLKSVLSITRRELEKANIKIVEQISPTPKIFCDPGHFSEVFLNMITNARDAMRPKGGTLTIKLDTRNDNIRIIFKDTGCGIPDKIKGKIFDPFVTTKGALGKSEIPGTGLGLFLTYGIVDSYHGKIEVESKEGSGTTFTISIPISKNPPRKPILETEIKPTLEIQKKLNILLVDDERPICITLKRFLESKGHKVLTSLRAEEGLEHFKKDKFDVILSDITMPDMDGIELVKKIRKKDKHAKIIVMTGHILKQKEEQAKNAGADEVLVKPFKNDLLYQTIARIVIQ